MAPLPRRTIDVRPVGGMILAEPGQEIPKEASPDMMNFTVHRGLLRKRPGMVTYPNPMTALGNRLVGVYSTHDKDNVSHLYSATKDTLFKYVSAAWVPMTGTLTGSDTDLMSWVNSQNSLLFCQGIDPVQLISFSGTTFTDLNADCPPAKYLERFADRVVLGYTIESATVEPFRVRWCVNSDHTDWVGLGSGFRDQNESPYFIRMIRKIGSAIAIYTEQSIIMCTRTGDGTAPLRFDGAAQDIGDYASRTLAGWREYHIFLGNDDFYGFNGAAPQPIGQPIRDNVFITLNPSSIDQNWGMIIPDTQEYCAFICESNDYPDKQWVYNFGRSIWYPWNSPGHTCGTLHRLDTSQTIDDLVGTIDEQGYPIDTIQLLQAFPAMLTGHVNGKLYFWSTAFPSDDGAAINAYWTSKDWVASDIDPGNSRHFITLRRVGVSFRKFGNTCTLYFSYSVDGGESWSAEDAVTFGGASVLSLGDVTWNREVTDKRIRVKFRNSSAVEQPQIAELHFDLAIDSQVF